MGLRSGMRQSNAQLRATTLFEVRAINDNVFYLKNGIPFFYCVHRFYWNIFFINMHYFRNLLFRVNGLLKAGIKLVFVIDGKPPEVKLNTIAKRLGSSG